MFIVFFCSCLGGWRTRTPVRTRQLWACRCDGVEVQHIDFWPPPLHPRSSTLWSLPLWPVGGVPACGPAAGRYLGLSDEHFQLLLQRHVSWGSDTLLKYGGGDATYKKTLKMTYLLTSSDLEILGCGRIVALPRKHWCQACPAGGHTSAPLSQSQRK